MPTNYKVERSKRSRTAGAFLIARTVAQRPTLQHHTSPDTWGKTLCGADFTGWSRAYQSEAIEAVICKRCKAKLS